MAALTRVNGTAYTFAQIIWNYGSVPVASVSEISWSVEQVKENNYGQGFEPVSSGTGTRTYSASVTMSMNDVEALREIAPNGDLTSLAPTNVVILFGNPQRPTKHTLKSFEFKNDGVEGAVNDTDLKVTFEGLISGVDRG